MFSQFKKDYSTGFSLLELIIVITLIGILAISLSGLVKNAIFGYIDAKDRNSLSQSAKLVIEKLARELREALPQSVRVADDGSNFCVEFIPITSASSYLTLPSNGPVTSFTAVGYNLASLTTPMQMAVMPINPNSIYSGAGTRATVTSITTLAAPNANQVQVTLDSPSNFLRRSPNSRFYLLGSPVSYCLNNTNGQITRYDAYLINTTQQLTASNIGGSASLVGENFSANGTVFNYAAGTLTRASLLQINIRAQNRNRNLSVNDETFDFFHEVHIRNVP